MSVRVIMFSVGQLECPYRRSHCESIIAGAVKISEAKYATRYQDYK